MWEQVDASQVPEDQREDLEARAKKLASASKQIDAVPGKIAMIADELGDYESADRADRAYSQPPAPLEEKSNLGILDLIDRPGREMRATALQAAGDKPRTRAEAFKAASGEGFADIAREEMPIYSAATLPLQGVGAGIGGIVGGLVGAGTETIRAAKGLIGKGDGADWSKVPEAIRAGGKVGADVGLMLPLDPLSYLGAPVKGTKGTVEIAARLAKGMADAKKARFLSLVERAQASGTATARVTNTRRAFKAAGLGDEFAKTFGAQGEMLGKGALEVGLPIPRIGKLGEKLSDLTNVTVPGRPFALRRPIAELAEAGMQKINKPGPWNPVRLATKEKRRLAHSAQSISFANLASKVDEAAAEMPPSMSQNPERTTTLLEHVEDPNFTLKGTDAAEDAKLAAAQKESTDLEGWKVVSTQRTGRNAVHVVSTDELEKIIGQNTRLEDRLARKLAKKQAKLNSYNNPRVAFGNQYYAPAPANLVNEITSIKNDIAIAQGKRATAEGKRLNVAAEAAPLPRGFVPPTAEEQRFLDKLQDTYEDFAQLGESYGMEIRRSGNLATGRYMPRQMMPTEWGADVKGALDFQKARSFALRKGSPLGEVLELQRKGSPAVRKMMISTDPIEQMTRQAGRMSRKIAQHRLKTSIVDQFGKGADEISQSLGLPPGTHAFTQSLKNDWVRTASGKYIPKQVNDLVEGTFKTGSLTQLAAGHGPVAEITARGIETMKAWFKRNRLARMGFATVNAVGDMASAIFHGFDKPETMLQAGGWIKGTRGAANYSGPQVQKMLLDWGLVSPTSSTLKGNKIVPSGTQNLLGVDFASEAQSLAAAAEQTAKVPFLKSKVKYRRALRRMAQFDIGTRAVQKTNDATADRIRAAFFVDGLEKGLAPSAAADRVFTALLDYSDMPGVVKWARLVMPFANWMMRAPVAAGKALATNPGRVATMPKMLSALNEPSEYAIPNRASERGPGFFAGPTLRRALETAFFDEIPQGQDPYLLARESFSEAITPVAQGFQGNIVPLAQGLSPGLRGVAEMVRGEDFFTGQPLNLESQGRVSENPQVNEWVGGLMRYIAPTFVPAYLDPVLNEAMSDPESGQPVARIGFMRPQSANAQQYMNARDAGAYGIAPYMADPLTRLQNAIYDPALQKRLLRAQLLAKEAEGVARSRNR
jgi:hypothetical protein